MTNITRHFLVLVGCVVSTVIAPCAISAAEPWSRFHGPRGQGYVDGSVLPAAWSESDYVWTHDLGSRDVGSPVVHGGNVFYLLSFSNAKQIGVQSIELATGKLRWTRKFDQPSHHLHKRNTFASSTPFVDDDFVFVAWSEPQHTYLKCFDHQGEEVWSRDFGSWQSQHGFGTSPVVYGDSVLLFNSQQADQLKPGQSAGASRMISVDRKTGTTQWETGLATTRSCYGVPARFEYEGKTQIVDANTGNGMFGLDPKTGRMLWNIDVFEMRCCSTPLVVGDLAIASSGSGGGGNHLVAVRIPKQQGEQPEQVYRLDRGAPYVPTPALRGDRLFIVDDKGIASCVAVKTGDVIWSKRVGGNFSASPVVIGDRLLLISLDGKATVLNAGDDYRQLGSFSLGAPVGATPALVDGYLVLRVGERLVCLRTK
jgi:outer membrane protein assembly factor BamB